MKPNKIRPLALCVFRHEGRILAGRNEEPGTGRPFYRPIGGRIEFGELGADCVVREVHEEIGAVVTGVRYLGLLESIFTYGGRQGHEICLIFDGTFRERSYYRAQEIAGEDDDGDLLYRAHWIDPQAPPDDAPLYPTGLAELLADAPPL